MQYCNSEAFEKDKLNTRAMIERKSKKVEDREREKKTDRMAGLFIKWLGILVQ